MDEALEPPSGINPDFVTPASLRKFDILGQTICLVLSTLFVWMRMYTKVRLTKSAGWEDYTCFIAWIGFIGYVAIAFVADRHGNGTHIWNLTEENVIEYAKLANASQIMYGPLMLFTKLSILLLCLKVFVSSNKSKSFRLIHLLLWTNFFFYFAATVVEIFECTPRTKLWTPNTPGKCVNISSLIISTAIINVISDFSILMLLILFAWCLPMGTKQKLGLSAVFLTGLFGCVSGIMRLIISIHNVNGVDQTYVWFGEFLWTSAEITSGIVCSCLPALPAFIRQICINHTIKFPKGRKKYKHDSFTFTPGESIIRPYTPGDSQLLQGTYIELQDDEGETPGHGITTTVRGGARISDETIMLPPAIRRSMIEVEQGDMGMGILKTVTVVRYPERQRTRF